RPRDPESAGPRTLTTLAPQVQHQVQKSGGGVVDNLEKGYRLPAGQRQAASLVVRTGTAEVLALVGSRKAGFVGFNRAVDARRQVGSTIKPAVYLAALQQPERYKIGRASCRESGQVRVE